MKKKKAQKTPVIALNRKAHHDYSIEQRFEAGIVLQGWEVKCCRACRVQLVDSYVILKKGEAFLLGVQMSPLPSTAAHTQPDPTRTRKLLLHKKQLSQLIGEVERKGYTLVALALLWKGNRVKADIALVKGKKSHDKRAAEKDRDWQRQKHRIIKSKGQGLS